MVSDRGNGIYRSIVLALAGLILLGANSPSQNSTGNSTAAEANQKAGQHENVSAAVSRIGNALEAQNAKTDPYEEDRNKREIRDLQAQENSAYWAEAMFWATTAALVLSTIGVGLVWITFKATKKSNDIAGDIGFKQLRAYVTVENAIQSDTSFTGENQGFLSVCVTLHNSGATPAIDVRVHLKKHVVVEQKATYICETFDSPDIGGQARQKIDLPWYKWEDFFYAEGPSPKLIEGEVKYKTAIPDDAGRFPVFSIDFAITPADRESSDILKVDVVRIPSKLSF